MPTKAQHQLDVLARSLDVGLRLLDNFAEEHGVDAAGLGASGGMAFRARITLTNTGEAISGLAWQLHVPTLRRILAIEEPGFEYRHITGDHHTITLVDPDLAAGESRSFTVIGESRLRHRPQVLPRWYLTAPGTRPRVIEATDTEDVRSFVEPLEEYARPWSSEDRYGEYTAWMDDHESLSSARVRVIPKPILTEAGAGIVDLSGGVRVIADNVPKKTLRVVRRMLARAGIPKGDYPILLKRNPHGVPMRSRHPEGYTLRITQEGATVCGADRTGAFYGVMSLLSLLPGNGCEVPEVYIEDAPRFPYRGLMIDLARNMPSETALEQILDQMAALKLNHLHLHLSDDEGWRVEIPRLPELTDVGSHRGHTEDESERLLAQLGSGPDGLTGSGYLTGKAYIKLVAEADSRGIVVIPEVDIPGHSRAAVISMERRYQKLRNRHPADAIRYRLVEEADESNLMTVQFYDRLSTVNPAMQSTLLFMDAVIETLAEYHQKAGQPLRIWHFGGDEVMNIFLGSEYTDSGSPIPGKGQVDQSRQQRPWQGSPAAQEMVADGSVPDVEMLPTALLRMLDLIVREYGVSTIIGWQDGWRGEPDASQFGSRVWVDVWQTLEEGAPQTLADFAERGFGVIACTPEFLYFDMSHGTDPDEPGVDWAFPAVHDHRIFAFAPENLAQVAETAMDRHGEHYRLQTPDDPEMILGIQAELWTELIRTDDRAMYMLFPRLLPTAERAWHRADWELDQVPGRVYQGGITSYVDTAAVDHDWRGFVQVLGTRSMTKLERDGIAFRIPPPGGLISNGLLHAATRYVSLPVQYRVDGGPWSTWSEPVVVPEKGLVEIRGGAPSGQRWTDPFPVVRKTDS